MKKLLVVSLLLLSGLAQANDDLNLSAIKRIRIHSQSEIKMLTIEACKELHHRLMMDMATVDNFVRLDSGHVFLSKNKYLNVVCLENPYKYKNLNWVEILTPAQLNEIKAQEQALRTLKKNAIDRELKGL